MQDLDYTIIDARGHESLRGFVAKRLGFPASTRSVRIRMGPARLLVVAGGLEVRRLQGIASGKPGPRGKRRVRAGHAEALLVH